MLTLLTPAQMYAFEKKHFDRGIPSLPFMERAAQAFQRPWRLQYS